MVEEINKQEIPEVYPASDIFKRDDTYFILVDMPGVSKDNLNISIDDKKLTVEGTTKYPEEEKGQTLNREFGNVKYTRSFTLADTVDKDKISANLKNGVLKLELPKLEELQPKKIEIQEG